MAKAGNDHAPYLSKIEKSQRQLRMLRKEFTAHATNSLHSDYDRGYFQVLENFVRRLERSASVQNMDKKDG